MSTFAITAFYKFVEQDATALATLRQNWLEFGKTHSMGGLVLVAPEGINGTVCGSPETIAAFKKDIETRFGSVVFKDSQADKQVFRRWSVKIKQEIVGLHQPDVKPAGPHKHLSPAEFDAWLKREDVIVLDTRNDYEYDIGHFEGAIDPKLKSFHEFPEYVAKANLPKDKTVLMYCTGGIRCEKALLEMEKQGYEHVYQLEGGILAYMQQFPNQAFKGECFVFDHRVAVDQELKPSQKYTLCKHCGDPADTDITCCLCSRPGRICKACVTTAHSTCSKNCAYHAARKLSKVS